MLSPLTCQAEVSLLVHFFTHWKVCINRLIGRDRARGGQPGKGEGWEDGVGGI